jgi:hypothetical protein
MGKKNRISAVQISSNSTAEITLEGKVKTVLIKNSGTSANALNVGFNENASDKISLPAGEGLALSLDDGTVFDGNRVYAAFAAANPNNTGFMILVYELEEEIC